MSSRLLDCFHYCSCSIKLISFVFTDFGASPERVSLTDDSSHLAGLHRPCAAPTSSPLRSRGVCSLTALENGVGGGGVQQDGAEMFGGFFLI